QGIVVSSKWQRLEFVPDPKRPDKMLQKSIIDGYVLDDRTCHKSPEGWSRDAIKSAIEWEADEVVVETNFGGDMAVAVLRGAADALGVHIPIKKITASRGKRARAEPVAALAERHRHHHVGVFPELEDQQCTWTDESKYSPDRMDAAVWPMWSMKVVGLATATTGSFPSQAA